MIRLFVAIEISEAVLDQLERFQSELRKILPGDLRWNPRKNFHLTLKFLGNTPEDRLDPIREALARVASRHKPFQLITQDISTFGEGRRLRNFWVGLAGALAEIRALATDLDAALEELGFPKEKRAFTPHLTLARTRPTTAARDKVKIGEKLRHVTLPNFDSIKVREVSLFRSILNPKGSIYECVGRFPLGHSV